MAHWVIRLETNRDIVLLIAYVNHVSLLTLAGQGYRAVPCTAHVIERTTMKQTMKANRVLSEHQEASSNENPLQLFVPKIS